MENKDLTLTNFNHRKFTVHTYMLEPIAELTLQKRPLVIVVPGGSFDHLSKRESEPVAIAFNNQGLNSVVMEYNLVQDAGDIYPDAGLDVLTTVAYFRKHAAAYHLDPDRIVTIGFSAGGHVVSVANNMALSPAYQAEYQFEAAAVRPNQTILGYPLINLAKIGFSIPENEKSKVPKDKKLLDSALGVTRETPPTFIFQAWDDPIVLISNALEYLTALNKNKVTAEAHLFSHGYHGFSIAKYHVQSQGRSWQQNPHVAHWFDLAMEWLKHEWQK